MVALLENLIKARKEAGLTQEKLSQLAGVDRSTLAHIERGDRSPSFRVATSISRVLKKPIDHLFVPTGVLYKHKTDDTD